MLRCAVLGHRMRATEPYDPHNATCTRCTAMFVRFDGHWIQTAFFGSYEERAGGHEQEGN